MTSETNETPLEDRRSQALRHYEEASMAIRHWSSFVASAIKSYDPNMQEQLNRAYTQIEKLTVDNDKLKQEIVLLRTSISLKEERINILQDKVSDAIYILKKQY